MTTGDYPNNPDPNFPPPGAYPPPPPPQYGGAPGAYPPPPPPPFGQPQYGQPGGGYPVPQFGPPSEPGSLGVRFGARLIDGIIVSIVVSILLVATGLFDGYIVPGIFSGVLVFVYFVAFEVTQGWTPGKKLLGLAVRGPGGAPKPDLRQSAIRNSFTLLSIIPFLGGLLAFIAYVVIAVTINGSPTKQGKHDELAGGTQVIKG